MSNNVQQQSPLAHTQWLPYPADAADAAAIALRERPLLQMITLRGDPADAGFMAAAQAALGVALPTQANTVRDGDAHGVAWMGPDEWLVQSRLPHGTAGLPARLAAVLEGYFASVVEVTSGYTVIDIDGPHAADVLAKGCAMDLHPRAFGAGACAQTRFFDAAVFLRRTARGIALTTRRSFAPYVAEMLVDAAREYA